MSQDALATAQWGSGYQIVEAKDLAAMWRVPESWVREKSRNRTIDPIPHMKLGRYVRYELGSPDLDAWWERHRRNAPAGKKPVTNAQGKHWSVVSS